MLWSRAPEVNVSGRHKKTEAPGSLRGEDIALQPYLHVVQPALPHLGQAAGAHLVQPSLPHLAQAAEAHLVQPPLPHLAQTLALLRGAQEARASAVMEDRVRISVFIFSDCREAQG